MTTLKLSGYLALEQAVTWVGATQKLDSAPSNQWTNLSDEIDNSTTRYVYADLDLVLGSAAFTGSSAGVEIYIVPTIDGTNYPDWTGNVATDAPENVGYFAVFLPVKATTAAHRIATPVQAQIALSPGKFKFAARNLGNVTLAASGNTLYFRPYSYDSV